MKKLPISLVVITLNEESNIERCLRSVPFVSDIVVVDSGSRDATVDLAQKMGARVFHEAWRGFGPQKRFAVEKAAYDWVLSLDADEALSPELAREIEEKFATFRAEYGYLMPRKSFHLGRWIQYGGWFPDDQLRLFNRLFSNFNEDTIHEKVEVSHRERLKAPILHWVFKNLSHQVVTNDRYSSLQAGELLRKGQGPSFWRLLLKPPTKFIECYFFKKGFLDGIPGLVIAISASYSVFLKWAKVWEEKCSRRNS